MKEEKKEIQEFINKNSHVNKYIKYLKNERNYSENTLLAYEKELIKFQTFLKEEKIKETAITKEQIRCFLKQLDQQKQKKSTISHVVSVLRSYYDYLLREDIIKENIMHQIKNPKISKKLPNFLSTMELEELFQKRELKTPYDIRNRLIIELLYATGMRVSELINLKLKDIQKEEKIIKTMGKGTKERIVYYGEYAEEMLKKYITDARPFLLDGKESEYLLVGKNTTKLTRQRIRGILEEEVQKVGLQHHISPHVLRHTFATQLLNNGADIRSVQELLGHANLSTTQIYTHITSEQLRKVYRDNMPRK